MSKREDVLIRFLSTSSTADIRQGLKAASMRQPFDWDYFLRVTSKEGVAALIYHRLQEAGFEQCIPDAVRQDLRTIYYTYSAHNTILYEAFNSVAAAFAEEGIPIIVLKGIFLAEQVYKSIALRPMRDIDLLVRRCDIQSAAVLLDRMGYRPLSDIHERLNDPYAYSLTFCRQRDGEDTPVSLDLHWHIFSASWMMAMLSKEFDAERLWSQSEPVTSDQAQVRTLSPQHLLLSLSVNGYTHCFERMIMVSDIAHVLRSYEGALDSSAWEREARLAGLANVCGLAVRLAKQQSILEKSIGLPSFYGFRRHYHPVKACSFYLLTSCGSVCWFRSFFRLCIVITRLVFKQLAHKRT